MDPKALPERIAVGVGGGIAAYKVCDLVREFIRAGAQVRVAMTRAAGEFVTPLSFQALSGNPVLTNYFNPAEERAFGHLDLARWAQAYVVAPATADLIARLRHGLADDPVTTSVLAFRGPVILAPSMNVAMFENPITQENLAALAAQPRFRIVGPEAGALADGETGWGRLAELKAIVQATSLLFVPRDLEGKKVLITAGPTREYLDPVRFISNPSSGKMGIALAVAAHRRGAEVTLVLGPSELPVPPGIFVVRVTSAEHMADACVARAEAVDYFVASAAVSDYRPETRLGQKKKKTAEREQLSLVRTRDVLIEVAERARKRASHPVIVGFAAETENLIDNALSKLSTKKLDLIVANDVTQADAGFAGDHNQVTILSRDGGRTQARGTKAEIAENVWNAALSYAAALSGTSGRASRP